MRAVFSLADTARSLHSNLLSARQQRQLDYRPQIFMRWTEDSWEVPPGFLIGCGRVRPSHRLPAWPSGLFVDAH